VIFTKNGTVKQFVAFGARGNKPPQEKPSAEASGGTAQRSTKHCQCSTDLIRFRRCARQHLLSAQCIYSAQRYTPRSATLRPALHIAQHCTARSATHHAALHSAQRHTAPSVSQRAAFHSAQRYTGQGATQRAVLYSAQRDTAPSAAQRAALHSAQRYTGPHATPSAEWGFGLAPNCRVQTLTLNF